MQKAPPMGLSLAAVVLGLLIAWIGSRPSWVDTFITAGVIFLTAALFGVFRPSQALLWALAIGAWVPLFGIALHSSYGSLLALAVAFL
jgi:hypothetical protein